MTSTPHQDNDKTPTRQTIKEVLNLSFPENVSISPDGKKIAYTVRQADWEKNIYENKCYIYDESSDSPFLLTSNGSTSQIGWLSNGSLLVLRADPPKLETNQLFIYRNLCGEGKKITSMRNDIDSFEIVSDGVIFLSENSPNRPEKYEHFEEEEGCSELYFLAIDDKNTIIPSSSEPINLLKGSIESLHIIEYCTSSTYNEIYLTCWPKPAEIYDENTLCYQVKLNEDKTVKSLIQLPLSPPACIKQVSPDGKSLLISFKKRGILDYASTDLGILSIQDLSESKEGVLNKIKYITEDFHREPQNPIWRKDGIFIRYVDRNVVKFASISEAGEFSSIDLGGHFLQYDWDKCSYSFSSNAKFVFIGENKENFPEICIADLSEKNEAGSYSIEKLSNLRAQVENWDFGTLEDISWASKDGTEIHGFLRKPSNFDRNKKYPLLFVIHGGPIEASTGYLIERGEDESTYPGIQFVQEGFIVVKVNYRGSLGAGPEFMELNKGNLGIGDLWDLESCVDYLASLGFIDEEKVGCMGWSQGGYISAFALSNSKKFKAYSIGAPISDWYTYHISGTYPQSTKEYLFSSPFKDRELYYRTSPIYNIKNATSPALLQHCEGDPVVSVVNSKELYRGLKEFNIPTELFIFKYSGHHVNAPVETLILMEQNRSWFNHYLLGKELDLYPKVELKRD